MLAIPEGMSIATYALLWFFLIEHTVIGCVAAYKLGDKLRELRPVKKARS